MKNTDDEVPASQASERAAALAELRQILTDVTASLTLQPLVRGSLQIALIQVSNTPQPPPSTSVLTPSKDVREDLRRVWAILEAEIAVASSVADSVRLGKISRHVRAALDEMRHATPKSIPGQP